MVDAMTIQENNPIDIDKQNIPEHVAIIMDGNGRWAESKGLQRIQGHQAGVESIRAVVREAREIGVQYLTLYAFSTENWQRPKKEVDFLMTLLSDYLDRELQELTKNNIRFKVIGRIENLPEAIREKISKNIEATKNNDALTLTLALSYSSRCEILDMVKKLGEKIQLGSLNPSDITEELIQDNLYTAGVPDPDFLIRTSGEMRISNFLLWQLSYTEIYVTEVLWPDFRKDNFLKAIQSFQRRERRFGRTNLAR